MRLRSLLAPLAPADILIVVCALILSALAVAGSPHLATWPLLVALNAAAAAGAVGAALWRKRTGSAVACAVHLWYVAPLVYLAFREVHLLIPALTGGRDYDALLIAADRALFGMDPTVWLAGHAHPLITEVLQIAYTSFYLLFFILGVEFHRRGETAVLEFFLFTAVYGFFLSYLGYFLLPAVGPRFMLHEYGAIDRELPGLLLTPVLRWFVDAGGGVPLGASPAEVLARAPRDVFPSGHTMMTLVVMVVAVRHRAATRLLLVAVGTLLIAATVYLRYHYVVDLLAGALFMGVCLATVRPLYRLLARAPVAAQRP
jgi:membrane-associated phospholipid phosphatase